MTGRTGRLTLAAGLLGTLAACAGVLFTAPPGSSCSLIANPPFVASDGGVSAITAFVIEPAGTTVSDGTVVLFFTDIGLIDGQAKTKDGLARVNFTSDSRSGVAHISAICGGAAPTTPAASPGASPAPTTSVSGTGSASITVTVGNVRVKAVVGIRAEPPRITTSNSTHVFARAIDENGNGIANAVMFFEVVTDKATEHFEVTGPVFTNQSGEAEDVLRTNRELAGNATVRARAIGAGVEVVSETLTIAIR
ncbi:MAG TPA: hypothetical protein VIK51_20305 [Vicinamibacteria bacterium]|jgi:hypothetical protein